MSISFGGDSPIGWFPLGPREVYVPSYQVSRDYFRQVNVNNTVINNTIITNVYNNYSSGTINVKQVNYANRTVPGAVTAIPRDVFVNAQPVQRSILRLDRKAATTGEITGVAPIAPSRRSVIGSGKAVEERPSQEATDRRVVVRNAPPPAERPFAAREQQLQKNPGRVLEPSAGKSEPKVRVIGEQRGAVNARAMGSSRDGDRADKQQQAEKQQQADKQQQVERQRQAEAQQQDQRQRKAASEKQADKQQLAECERQAIQQNQDMSRCARVTQPQESSDSGNRGKGRK